MIRNIKTLAGLGLAAMALTGCNLGSSGSGSFSLDVTDAPVDEAAAVNVVFEGVDIRAANGTTVSITYDEAKTIDLLNLQGGETEALLEDEILAAGEYEWIRLRVDADKGTGTSTIEFTDQSQQNLFIPSGSETGLKLVRGFTVPVNGSVAFTIDFDLRKSVVKTGEPNPTYILKPALRLVDNTEVGEISGTVSQVTINDVNEDTTGACNAGKAVYVYEGADVTPGDVGGDGVEPTSSALVEAGESGELGYTAAFLVEGDYTVTFTCDADLDDPEADDSSEVDFVGTRNVTVSAGATSTANFQ